MKYTLHKMYIKVLAVLLMVMFENISSHPTPDFGSIVTDITDTVVSGIIGGKEGILTGNDKISIVMY